MKPETMGICHSTRILRNTRPQQFHSHKSDQKKRHFSTHWYWTVLTMRRCFQIMRLSQGIDQLFKRPPRVSSVAPGMQSQYLFLRVTMVRGVPLLLWKINPSCRRGRPATTRSLAPNIRTRNTGGWQAGRVLRKWRMRRVITHSPWRVSVAKFIGELHDSQAHHRRRTSWVCTAKQPTSFSFIINLARL